MYNSLVTLYDPLYDPFSSDWCTICIGSHGVLLPQSAKLTFNGVAPQQKILRCGFPNDFYPWNSSLFIWNDKHKVVCKLPSSNSNNRLFLCECAHHGLGVDRMTLMWVINIGMITSTTHIGKVGISKYKNYLTELHGITLLRLHWIK